MTKKIRVLFVVENDYYPRDMRVYNECTALSGIYSCYVLAPRRQGQKLIERIESVTCFRFPHFEAHSLKLILLEYSIAVLWIALLVPLICLLRRIKVVHVANPPDFIIPAIAWLKIFGIRITFDVHDLSVETFRGKRASRSAIGRLLVSALDTLESWSILIADLIVTTNSSIQEYVTQKSRSKTIYVVRNSNPILFENLREVNKREGDGVINIGYFGVLADDEAAGLDHFFSIAEVLDRHSVPFRFSIVGDGPGLRYLRRIAKQKQLENRFRFFGFVEIPEAFELIKNFDFGLVTWGYLAKNHLHTAMKIMDYMCCGVPVCSLLLKEQVTSTQGIGIQRNTFEEVAEDIVRIYASTNEYQTLREATLSHFNSTLAWEFQERALISAYSLLLKPEATRC
jgi:glycosyltransferase involved in cell wall biosynthesis